jgi:hypothetical protein
MASTGTIREPVQGKALRISVEELARQLATIEAELNGGRAVELMRGETVVAEVRAPRADASKAALDRPHELPDFMGRMRALWGDKVLPEGTGASWVREDRDARG